MDALVSTDWLADNLDTGDLRILDASWFIANRDARAEFEAGHISGAQFLDLASFADPDQAAPMMLPPAAQFAARLSEVDITTGDRIVLYDDSPFKTSARAWWMLHKVFGLPDVAILDGGLGKWKAEGRPVEAGSVPTAHAAPVSSARNERGVRTLSDMQANLDSGAEQIVDARGAGRFNGLEGEPRPEVTPGHIPGSINLPYGRFFNENSTFKRGAELEAAFEEAGVDLNRPVVGTCGSGVTAAVLVFATHLIGKDIALYDGSWSEWGAHPDTPKASSVA